MPRPWLHNGQKGYHMFDKKSEQLAKRFGILNRMEKLDADLSRISNIVHVEYDVRDYEDLKLIIIVPKYNFDQYHDMNELYWARMKQLSAISEVCKNHGLYTTGDSIEDYGEHWYIVRKCDHTWHE